MSEAKVRWGVTVNGMAPGGKPTGKRERVTSGGPLLVSNSRRDALARAAIWEDDREARLVKLTRRAKGWRPASEPPKPTLVNCDLLVRLDNGARRTAYWNTVCWHGTDSSLIYCNVTHWRELPAGPK